MDGHRTRTRMGLVATAAVTALAVATIGFGLASASPANGVHDERFKALEPYDQQTSTYVDLGEPGLSQGDLGTFSGEIYDAKTKAHIGYENSECVVGVVGGQTFQFVCSGYFVLNRGQITMEGTIELPVTPGPKALRSPATVQGLFFHWAITGGTGKYESVGGQLNWGGNNPNATILKFDVTR
jgi:hypothetical protein